jgi:hypothetical protein
MKKNEFYFINLIKYYNPLLIRYARRIIHNERIAENIVKTVLEEQYEIDKLRPSSGLRKDLKNKVKEYCILLNRHFNYLQN